MHTAATNYRARYTVKQHTVPIAKHNLDIKSSWYMVN